MNISIAFLWVGNQVYNGHMSAAMKGVLSSCQMVFENCRAHAPSYALEFGPHILGRPRNIVMQSMSGVQGPVRVAEQFARQENEISLVVTNNIMGAGVLEN